MHNLFMHQVVLSKFHLFVTGDILKERLEFHGENLDTLGALGI